MKCYVKTERHREKKSLHPDSGDGPAGNRADGLRHRAAGQLKKMEQKNGKKHIY